MVWYPSHFGFINLYALVVFFLFKVICTTMYKKQDAYGATQQNDPKRLHLYTLTCKEHMKRSLLWKFVFFIIVFKIYITKIHINIITFVLQIRLFDIKKWYWLMTVEFVSFYSFQSAQCASVCGISWVCVCVLVYSQQWSSAPPNILQSSTHACVCVIARTSSHIFHSSFNFLSVFFSLLSVGYIHRLYIERIIDLYVSHFVCD